MAKYAFFPTGPSYKLPHSSMAVSRWTFYTLGEEQLRDVTIPYEEVEQDDSQVGTVLEKWFRKIGYHQSGNCTCKEIGRMLDQAGLEFIRRHHDDIVNLIHDSAAQLRVNAPRGVLSRILSIAIWREARRTGK